MILFRSDQLTSDRAEGYDYHPRAGSNLKRKADPNHIVFILPQYAVGGAEKQLANLIGHRPTHLSGVEVSTITFLPSVSSEVERMYEIAGARNILVNRESQPFPRFFLELVRAIRRSNPAIVSTFLDSSVGAWGRLAALMAGVPLIVHSDRLLTPEGTRAHYMLRPHLDRRTARFLPNANAIAQRLMADGVPGSKIVVMPNGVDLKVFDPASVASSRSQWGVPAQATVLGYLGRFAPQKRVDLLLRALVQLPEHERPDYVVLGGDGRTMPLAREIAASDPWLRERSIFLGTIDNTPGFLAGVDYLVLPTEAEGLPNVVLEAMAMGVPVVSTEVSDIPMLIGDTGLIARPSSVESLADSILDMQRRGATGREELSVAARRRIAQHYSQEAAAERFWKAHLDLLGSVGADGNR